MSHFPLDAWLAHRMGRAPGTISRKQLRDWLTERLRETVAHAKANSPFYARTLALTDTAGIDSLEHFSRLPMMTADDLRNEPEQILCVSQDEIERVVTLQTSGTTGKPKRVFHTAEDLEATTDFFHYGMLTVMQDCRTAFVLLPGDRPGGVGRLLGRALDRFGARCVAHGEPADAREAVDGMLAEGADCLIGSPAHAHLVACEWARRGLPRGVIRSTLLCWDTVPDSVIDSCTKIFGCRTHRHWGMIETGLGGGVECVPGSGMHLRETDVFVEVIDPTTGVPLPVGDFGELLVSTPMRRGMPLIRYRTGDFGRIMPGPCGCGSPLRRLDSHIMRAGSGVTVKGGTLLLADLNECLYKTPGVSDFVAGIHSGTLRLTVSGIPDAQDHIKRALQKLPAVARSGMDILIEMKDRHSPAIPGLGKRRLEEYKENPQ